MKKIIYVLLFLWANLALSQVKVGDNINTIDAASILELESASKVFVVTRISTAQMNAITPLNGALVYNTDENCLYQYRNNAWVSLCVDITGGQTITVLVDNSDGTFTYSNEDGVDVIISKANFSNNGDGTYTFTNGALTDLIIDTNANAIPYDNSISGLLAINVQQAIDELQASATVDDDITAVSFDGTDLTVDEGATTFSADLSALEESADITAEETRALAAEAAIQSNVDANETAANAAIALKEDAANKSTDGTLVDNSDVDFPTEQAVKTYVDGQIAATADDDITAVSFDGTDLTVDEGATTFSADLSALEESADITAEETRALAAEALIQADVDQNETDADTSIAANATAITDEETRALAAEAAIQADVDQNETDADTAIAVNATAITAEETRALAAEALIQADVDANETAANTAIALKEDAANKSTDGTLVDNSDVDFPTEQAVKTYVDGQIAATADDDITAVSFDGTDLTVDEGATTFSADLSALEESADITAEETRALAAETVIQADVDANEVAANAAITLKEDAANKSTDGTLVDNSDVDFPTEQAVKTYVDGQIAATADDDITAVSFDGTDLTVDEGATTFSADLSALEESADITAEETRALAAEAGIQTDVNQNETDADTAIAANATAITAEATRALAAETVIQADVDANEAATNTAIALKEDTANKSTDGTLVDNSDVDFPTEQAVKTYVDGQINTISTLADGNIYLGDATNTAQEVPITGDATLSNTGILTLTDDAVTAAKINADVAGIGLSQSSVTGALEVDALTITDVVAGNKIATVLEADGTLVEIDETITSLESIIGTESTIRYTNEAGGFNDIPNIVRSVNGVNPAANGNVAVILSSVTTGLETNLPAVGVDSDIYIVSGEVAPNADRNGVAFIFDDVTGWQEVTTDLSTNDARYVNVNGDAMIGPLAMGDFNITNLKDPTSAQDAVTKNYVDTGLNLKEDTANKSTDGTLAGNSDVDFPTEQAVKTYVDAQITATADDDITAVSFDGTDLTVDEGATTFSADLSALEESADITAEETRALAAEAAIQADVDQNETDADTAIAANATAITDEETRALAAEAAIQADVDQNETDADTAIAVNATAITAEETRALAAEGVIQADVDANEAAANTAIALKEDTANKSTDGTLVDNSDVDFPTEQAVKTYVDGQIAATADDDITAVSFDGTDLTVDEGATTFSADLSALEESADITAEETRALAAEAAIQADVDQNETDADTAIAVNTTAITAEETRALNAEGGIQADVDANEAAANTAIALKEDAANKSTDGTLVDNSDVDFPTEQAVKTYVDGQIAATADDDITAVSFDGTDLTVDEGATTFSADLSALEESADITAEETRALASEGVIQADVDANEAAANVAINTNAANILAHNTADTDLSDSNEIQTLSIAGNALSISGTGGNMVTLPSISGTQGSVFFADTDGSPTEDNAELFWNNSSNSLGIGTASPLNKLEVSGAIRSQGILNSNGTVNEPSYRFSGDTNTGIFRPAADEIGLTVGAVEAIRIDETSGNTTVTINETLELNGQVLDENDSAGTNGQILTATTTGTAWVDNSSPIKAFGKISSAGTVTRATTDITVTKLTGIGHYRINLPIGMVSDGDYIIQLSQPGRAGAGNDDPGISYSSQDATGFDVIIGDNDNGGTDRARFDSEFMFTILDL